MDRIIKLPSLGVGASAQLAGILPLSSLLEFVDVVTKLHLYELSGRGIAWNWPVTPVGARVLLDRARVWSDDLTQPCVLDGGERLPPLNCIDMRLGDAFVCANHSTVRQSINATPIHESYRVPDLTLKYMYSRGM